MDISPFVGLPYKDMGRDYSGVDCWGLVYLVYRDLLGIAIPSYVAGCKPPFDADQRASVIDDEITAWRKREPGQEQLWDAVLMRMGRHLCHVGVLAPRGMLLHCEDGMNAVLEPVASPALARRIEGYYWYDPGA